VGAGKKGSKRNCIHLAFKNSHAVAVVLSFMCCKISSSFESFAITFNVAFPDGLKKVKQERAGETDWTYKLGIS
jgi:hypothetical protein